MKVKLMGTMVDRHDGQYAGWLIDNMVGTDRQMNSCLLKKVKLLHLKDKDTIKNLLDGGDDEDEHEIDDDKDPPIKPGSLSPVDWW